ncbi:hypothetical protein RRG08_059730 [Elysia crispata]|uniref:Uncharacterized protein n=1 Tax=Elysia crispata TaxID=231223 RepID=A0AAE0YPZ2_9GAST|nr:hypothetical protein RRG08_059730 [Elysia crispata]
MDPWGTSDRIFRIIIRGELRMEKMRIWPSLRWMRNEKNKSSAIFRIPESQMIIASFIVIKDVRGYKKVSRNNTERWRKRFSWNWLASVDDA